jgi:hypothetical protein
LREPATFAAQGLEEFLPSAAPPVPARGYDNKTFRIYAEDGAEP